MIARGKVESKEERQVRNVSIGSNIKALRQSAGISQAKLAEKVYVDPSMISKIEQDRKIPTLPLAAAIADALECDIKAFME